MAVLCFHAYYVVGTQYTEGKIIKVSRCSKCGKVKTETSKEK